MELASFLRLAVQIAAALGKVHQRGLVHKDVKPANILVNHSNGEVITGLRAWRRGVRASDSLALPESIAGTLAGAWHPSRLAA